MITEDIWVLMKDFSVTPIHQADTYLSEEEQKCAIVVVRPSEDSTWRGWWWRYEWQLVPWLSAQHSHDLPMSLFERRTYSYMVSYQWKTSHKGPTIQLICGDDSVTTEENDSHFNLLSTFQL